MKVAIGQIECMLGDIQANTAAIVQSIGQAAERGCDVVVLPELSDTGYDLSVVAREAREWDGPPYVAVAEAAARHKVTVICGLSERSGTEVYNALAVLSPEGELVTKYRKAHLLCTSDVREDTCFVPGDSLVQAHIGGMTWGLSICYDLRYPELYRRLAIQGAEVLVNCAAWPSSRVTHWDSLIRARAIENQAYVVAANRAGADGPLALCGKSCIMGPFGGAVAEASASEPGMIVGEVSREQVLSVRKRLPVWEGRREDLYGNLG